jgi:hypothetical protein
MQAERSDRRGTLIVVGLAVLLACGIATCGGAVWLLKDAVGWNWSRTQIEESKRIGDTIIVQIERYSADHGMYPNSLDDLVPEYLERITPPVAGLKRWEYTRLTSEGAPEYELAFPSNRDRYPICFYHPGSGWYLDD